MKIKEQTFEKDKWGFYITPLIGYSDTPSDGKTFWIGWLRWLWTVRFKKASK